MMPGWPAAGIEKKKAFIYFHAEWCTYCAEMDRKTFTDPEVAGLLNRSFIPIRVDADRDRAAASLFRVKGLPDIWFMTEAGEVIGHRAGFIPPDQMLKILNTVLTEPPGEVGARECTHGPGGRETAGRRKRQAGSGSRPRNRVFDLSAASAGRRGSRW